MNAEYQKYLDSPHWKETRKRKKGRGRGCAICGSMERLDVHHLNYRNLVDVGMSDLRVLCRYCHELAHVLHRAGVFRFKNTNNLHRWQVLSQAVQAHFREGHPRPSWRGVVTKRWLMYYATPKGAWTRGQVELLGAEWPPVKGWLSKLKGTTLPIDVAQKFEAIANAAWEKTGRLR